MLYHAPFDLGETRSLTPEGFLLCRDVPIARTGRMVYHPKDLPGLAPGSDGKIQVDRSAHDLFQPVAIASTNGKAVTVDHPKDGSLTGPTNYRDWTMGSVLNPRQGQGDNEDCIVCDLLIQDQKAIDALHAGYSQVSWGYDAGYAPTDIPGHYRQHSLIGNHVALVKIGRCGPRCAVGDSGEELITHDCSPTCGCNDKTEDTKQMSKRAVITKTLDAIETALDQALGPDKQESPDAVAAEPPKMKDANGDTHIHVHLNGSNPGVASMSGQDAPDKDVDDMLDPEDPAAAAAAKPEAGDAEDDPMNEIRTTLEGILKRLDALEGNAPGEKLDAEMTPEAAEAAAAEEDEDETNDKRGKKSTGDKRTKDESPQPAKAFIEGGKNPIDTSTDTMPAKDARGKVKMRDRRTRDEDDEGGSDVDMEPGDSPLETMDSTRVTRDSAGKVRDRDSKHLEGAFREAISRGAILAANVAFPTFDAKTTATLTIGKLCGYRRKVLRAAFSDTKGREHVTKFFPNQATLDSATCDTVRMAFIGATEAAARANNTIVSSLRHVTLTNGSGVRPKTGAEINARNAERWK